MAQPSVKVREKVIVERSHLQELLDVLTKQGFVTIGPTVKDEAIVYDEITSVDQLPEGVGDQQDGGTYRLEERGDKALFGYVLGPYSWKKFLYPPSQCLWKAQQVKGGFKILKEKEESAKYAFVGVRPCEIKAMEIHDKVFDSKEWVDVDYKDRRDKAFIVSVNCTEPGGTCFCVSMNTGPGADSGFDISLTEIIKGKQHYFMAEAGSSEGAEVLSAVTHMKADEKAVSAADSLVSKAAKKMGRKLDTTDIKEMLYRNDEHPRWTDVAKRCQTCGNCTLVCPTCFCVTIKDHTDINGKNAERWRTWDSCFTTDFSYIHGGSVRTSPEARYRHWITHKLAAWIDQFGTSGCVGCGRCITWCPVGIDITEEAQAVRESERVGAKKS
jgi:formate hydrogenlyase subunit 6/NADH:ubiquinone oxidoreductase subunit I